MARLKRSTDSSISAWNFGLTSQWEWPEKKDGRFAISFGPLFAGNAIDLVSKGMPMAGRNWQSILHGMWSTRRFDPWR